MIRIGVLGGGSAATLHSEAILACAATELIGVGGRRGTGEALAAAAGVPVLTLADMAETADVVVIAVPPDAAREAVSALDGHVDAMLVESPVPSALRTAALATPVAGGANLLHAPVVKRAQRHIATMRPHHMEIRSRHRQPAWITPFGGAGPALDPGVRLAGLALAMAGRAATAAEVAEMTHPGGYRSGAATPDRGQRLAITLDVGTVIAVECVWADTALDTELEVADERSVVRLRLYPTPELEIDGDPVESSDGSNPIEALGFVEQIRRLALLAAGKGEPWPPAASLAAVTALIEQATSPAS